MTSNKPRRSAPAAAVTPAPVAPTPAPVPTPAPAVVVITPADAIVGALSSIPADATDRTEQATRIVHEIVRPANANTRRNLAADMARVAASLPADLVVATLLALSTAPTGPDPRDAGRSALLAELAVTAGHLVHAVSVGWIDAETVDQMLSVWQLAPAVELVPRRAGSGTTNPDAPRVQVDRSGYTFPTGATFVRTYKGTTYTLTRTAAGWTVSGDGLPTAITSATYGDPSPAAIAVIRHRLGLTTFATSTTDTRGSQNGWTWWRDPSDTSGQRTVDQVGAATV